ncbi:MULTISPECIES: hypothetical protein [unclassified Bacillus (in: firmicutes)]|uniref:hypothetical protein n=1 Tax=unclassified Bacillus (in: firmicutes) TaxID=185979 RepID=UPI0008F37370|nr:MULTISPECIES: hypothetical protein [unclassified Bacillus (in: firmicutes)]SFA91074.1 hypothetical protein SAMN02799634_102536 [Bacillus sp. UNCCL13]SFQ85486.1 hypothetical protein SAMN04488577_2656 [Bacillus sp. cl95]
MNHEQDYDSDFDREDDLTKEALQDILKQSHERETELMRNYLMVEERLHGYEDLKNSLENFAEGNAKRSKQLEEALQKLH